MNAIVTGSSRGLGFAISRKFVEEGINVAISSRKENDVNKALEELKSLNSNTEVLGHPVDFNNKENVSQYVDDILNQWKEVDILVNNVGIYAEDRADDSIENNLEKVLKVNLFSSVRINERVIESMKQKKNGFIFNIISIAAKDLRHDAASYTISKLALKGYNDLLREALKKHGIRVIALYPGSMNTSSWDESDVNRDTLIQMPDMTSAIMNVLKLSSNTTIEEIVINTLGDI